MPWNAGAMWNGRLGHRPSWSDWVSRALCSPWTRVPLGFVCGYPLPGSGELYGGSMYIPSAATDTLQGQAMQKINIRWGDDGVQPPGRESLAGPVCKKKYKPFLFRLVRVPPRNRGNDEAVGWQVQVERLYGCVCHHEVRRHTILQYGERPGWEPFGQWSMKKALQRAKQETIRLNAMFADMMAENSAERGHVDGMGEAELDETSTEGSTESTGRRGKPQKSAPTALKMLPLCVNGDCLWKVKTAYDDIVEEIQESLQSSDGSR